MSKLERLNSRVEKLLSKAVQEVLEVVKETVSEYQEKTARTQRENQSLKRRLQELQESIQLESNGNATQTPPAPGQSDATIDLLEEIQTKEEGKEIQLDPSDKDKAVIFPSCSSEEFKCEASTSTSCTSDQPAAGPHLSNSDLSDVVPIKSETDNGFLEPTLESVLHNIVVIDTEKDQTVKEEVASLEYMMQDTSYLHGEASTSATSLHAPNLEFLQANTGLCSEAELSLRLDQNGTEGPLTLRYSNMYIPRAERHYTTQRNTKAGGSGLRIFQRNVRKHYCCSLCGRTFKHSGDYKKHSRVHTGEKPYGCSVCGKRFSQSGCLTVHLRYHTGERPFKCRFCGKSFSHSSNMRKHEQIHM